jgi:hypothetical protein
MAWGLAILLGATVSAQTGSKENKDVEGNDQSQSQTQAKHSREQCETIRGELASVSVLGETMVDYSSGRGFVANLTYLTILGTPFDADRERDKSGSDEKDRKPSGGQTSSDPKDSHGQGESPRSRRKVYQIAVGPETQVECKASKGSHDADEQKDSPETSSREKSQTALSSLELGDRVRVEFDRVDPGHGSAKLGTGEQTASGNRAKHGRHRIIRGVAKKIMILSTPEERDKDENDQGARDQQDDQSKSKD